MYGVPHIGASEMNAICKFMAHYMQVHDKSIIIEPCPGSLTTTASASFSVVI